MKYLPVRSRGCNHLLLLIIDIHDYVIGYRLFENYDPDSKDACTKFGDELERRLFNLDTSELQRVDRCTMAHGLEARVPFLDLNFVRVVMEIDHKEVSTYIISQ